MKTQTIVGIVLLLAIGLFLFKTKSTQKVEHLEESAADACKKISSDADKIKANWDGAAKVAGQLNPLALIVNGLKGGENNLDTETRNIINETITSDMKTKIDQACANTAANFQSNVIDTTKCEYCNRFGCDITNVQQLNASDVVQDCTLTSAVTALMKQGSDSNAQALAQAIQKSQGILSGNNTMTGDTCNVINKDISASTYLETIARCANEATSNQENILSNCGNATNVVQKNINKQIQDCIIGNVVDTSTDQTATTKVTSEVDSEQESTGIDTTVSIIFSIVCCLSVCSIISVVLYGGSQSKQGKQMISKYY
jgi:hypothetical protein